METNSQSRFGNNFYLLLKNISAYTLTTAASAALGYSIHTLTHTGEFPFSQQNTNNPSDGYQELEALLRYIKFGLEGGLTMSGFLAYIMPIVREDAEGFVLDESIMLSNTVNNPMLLALIFACLVVPIGGLENGETSREEFLTSLMVGLTGSFGIAVLDRSLWASQAMLDCTGNLASQCWQSTKAGMNHIYQRFWQRSAQHQRNDLEINLEFR